MQNDTLEISAEAQHRLDLEKSFVEGWMSGRRAPQVLSTSKYISEDWEKSDTKRAMES